MNESLIQTVMGRELRAVYQAMGKHVSRGDLSLALDKMLINVASKRDMEILRTMLDDIRSEIRQQRSITQQATYSVENLKNQIQYLSKKMR